jgi:hypothetical protein
MTRRAQLIPDADRIEAARLAGDYLVDRLSLSPRPGWWHYCDSVGGVISQGPERTNAASAAIPDGPANLQLAQGAVGPSFAELDRLAPRAWS